MSDYLKTFTFTLLKHLAHLEWDYTLRQYCSVGSYLYKPYISGRNNFKSHILLSKYYVVRYKCSLTPLLIILGASNKFNGTICYHRHKSYATSL